ncbi:MAG TPA: hypothetical protein VJ907_08850 [Halanaerobiales bacterium]|nr:hypothetical protein [Halanaerobiales bacterium]
MVWIYDLETYMNLFTATFKNIKTQEVKVFVLSEDRFDLDALYVFIDDKKKWLVGYNSYNFDNQILNYIYRKYNEVSALEMTTSFIMDIYNLAKTLINSDVYEFKYGLPFQWLDLMKIGFYRKSLKLIGVSLKWPKLQDLPIDWDRLIKKEEIQIILDYNLNDVLITEQLFYHLENNIKLRFNIAKRYGVNVFSESDSGVANRLLEKFYSETTGLAVKDFRDMRTERDFIRFDWVVFDEVNFQTNTLDTVLEEVKNFVYYKNRPFFSKKIKFDGVYYKMGVGGLHSVDEGAMFEETDKEYLIDADIGSMYPATFINYQLTPAHLGNKFLKNYTDLRNERIVAKRNKDMTPAEGLKIVLNSSIGKTLNKNHWLYDPLVNLKVTVNGQLFLLMLIERLSLKGFKTISANTDGITVIVPKDKEDLYYKICKNWEKDTRYELEYAYYKLYARRDVNNYIAIKTNNEIKTKGIFISDLPKRFSNMTDPLNKGWDKPIVSKALHDFFTEGVPIKDTITNCKDIHQFCIAKKTGDDFANEYHKIEDGQYTIEKLQNSVRYYISTIGGTLLKRKENGEVTNYESKYRVTIFNNYIEKDIKDYNINYTYYINSAQKVLDEIINPQLSLF